MTPSRGERRCVVVRAFVAHSPNELSVNEGDGSWCRPRTSRSSDHGLPREDGRPTEGLAHKVVRRVAR